MSVAIVAALGNHECDNAPFSVMSYSYDSGKCGGHTSQKYFVFGGAKQRGVQRGSEADAKTGSEVTTA